MSNQPNIILISTDQQRWDTLPPHKPSWLRTPHLDDIRRQGIQFTRAYTDTPICVASRTSIMTGKTVFEHGMFSNGDTSTVMGHTETLPGQLKQLGYQTAAIGKMHFGPERCRHGFDEMILPADYYKEMERSGNPQQPMRHGLGQNELMPGMATVPEALTLTSWTAEKCVQYIRERRDPTQPFFMWCSFSKPHPPLDPPEPYYSMYRNCEMPEPVIGDWATPDKAPPGFIRPQKQWSNDIIPPEILKEAKSAYYGLITHCDYAMGRIFAALQDLDLFGETLIIFVSDHGEYLGDHLAGCKVFFHEQSAAIPMIVRTPRSWGSEHSGTTDDGFALLADIMPTVLEAAGGTPAPDVTGKSLLPGRAKRRDRVVAAGRTKENPSVLCLMEGDYKYHYWPEGAVRAAVQCRR